MASSPITSWEVDGETVETASDFILGGSKITVLVIAAMNIKEIKSCKNCFYKSGIKLKFNNRKSVGILNYLKIKQYTSIK